MSEQDPQGRTPGDDPATRPTAAATPVGSAEPGPPTRWQRTTRPSSWTRRTAVVVAGLAGLVLGVLLTGAVLAATIGGPSGPRGDGLRDRPPMGPGTSAHERGFDRGDRGDGRGPRGDAASGPIVVQVQPGATVQVAPGATVQTVPGTAGQPGQPGTPTQPAQPGRPAVPTQPAQPGQPAVPTQPAQPGQAPLPG
ncbi:hypothetical protein [Actinomycetospora lemnae]|uniref:Uncharacterized protein n=1 Tax=Actinomycetospora lemnae TaxID=3019891 RepID=A0ABT5T0Q3_9PSEU|nr:hypothetical protein [Actinomycetospora sp. DW7H6]MDD7968698.1 hypothetical protein [Actinomycetospora sp. DW7H6]